MTWKMKLFRSEKRAAYRVEHAGKRKRDHATATEAINLNQKGNHEKTQRDKTRTPRTRKILGPDI